MKTPRNARIGNPIDRENGLKPPPPRMKDRLAIRPEKDQEQQDGGQDEESADLERRSRR
jgi:hypothetical protein